MSRFFLAVKPDKVKRFKYEINKSHCCQKNRDGKVLFIVPAENRGRRRDSADKHYCLAEEIAESIFIFNFLLSDAYNEIVFFLFANEKAPRRNNYADDKPCNINVNVHFFSLPFINGNPLSINNTEIIKLIMKTISQIICVLKYS